MASNLSDKESTISFVGHESSDLNETTEPSQPELTTNVEHEPENSIAEPSEVNQNEPAISQPDLSFTKDGDAPEQESTILDEYPVPNNSATSYPSELINLNEPTESIREIPDEKSRKDTRIKLDPHRMVCCPPKRGCKALGEAFGLSGKLNTMLWRENFYRRVMENEVGFCVRNACICCLPMCRKTIGNMKPRESEMVSNMEDDSDDRKEQKENDDYVSGEQDGMEFYRRLIKLEMRMPRHTGIHKKTAPRADYIISEIRAKEKELENASEVERKRGLEELERKLAPKHHHNPWFIIVISIIQLIGLIVSLSLGGFALTGVEPKIELVHDMKTFRGVETYDIWHRPNIWIGPPIGELIRYGAIYAPCMRYDEVVTINLLSQPHGDKGELGCCVVKKHDVAGTTTFKECGLLTMGGGAWYSQPCSKLKPKKTILKPCCFGYLGNCKMATAKGCKAHGGYYFDSKEHCSQVFCFPHFCGTYRLEADKDWHFMPGSINQTWRYVASLFFHAGILHFAIVFTVQWCAGRSIEAAAGHVRIALVYLSGTIGGNMVGSFFDPYLPQVGCSGGVFSLLGISVIECVQAWHFRKRKYSCELLIVIAIMLFLVIAGFLPFINNFAHFGGLLFGIPVALAVMPHLCFNRWTRKARRIIFIISLIVLIVFVIIFIVLFYVVQDTGFCMNCYYFSCLPYTENVCNVLVELHGTLSHD